MALKAGTTGDLADSMAKMIEEAMQAEWPYVMGDDTSFTSNTQLQLLCVAVAQGVVKYLSTHASSLTVHVTSDSGTFPVTIATTGTLR